MSADDPRPVWPSPESSSPPTVPRPHSRVAHMVGGLSAVLAISFAAWATLLPGRSSKSAGRDPGELGVARARETSSLPEKQGETRTLPVVREGVPGEILAWAEVLEIRPDPKVVTDASLRAAIEAEGLPWRVRDQLARIELLLVPPGSYRRGASPGGADSYEDELPAHTVRISKAFYLGRYEVMQSEWRRVEDGVDAPWALGPPQRNISHDDIVEWLAMTPGLRLPTEGEWEYACRAGSLGPRYGVLDEIAVCKRSSVAIVGTKRANSLGLHDMLGNVAELCSDWYGLYDSLPSVVIDPQGPTSGSRRVTRGGSYWGVDWFWTASRRLDAREPDKRSDHVGFRVARTPY